MNRNDFSVIFLTIHSEENLDQFNQDLWDTEVRENQSSYALFLVENVDNHHGHGFSVEKYIFTKSCCRIHARHSFISVDHVWRLKKWEQIVINVWVLANELCFFKDCFWFEWLLIKRRIPGYTWTMKHFNNVTVSFRV